VPLIVDQGLIGAAAVEHRVAAVEHREVREACFCEPE